MLTVTTGSLLGEVTAAKGVCRVAPQRTHPDACPHPPVLSSLGTLRPGRARGRALGEGPGLRMPSVLGRLWVRGQR